MRHRPSTISSLAIAVAFAWVSGGAGVSGCTNGADPGADELGQVVAPATVCASGPTLFGIDVSKWQGNIDWARVKAAGVEYAFIRVSDGIATIDEKFVPNWVGAGLQDIPRGVYQFFRPHRDPIEQADIVIDHLLEYGVGELPPVIDVEATNDQTPATVATNVGLWIDRVESVLGVTPIIYTGRYFWNDNVRSNAYSTYPLWHAQYTSAACPNIADAWSDWLIWQYSSSGRVDGIAGDVDMNRFNGDRARLLGLVGDPTCREEPDYEACRGTDIEFCSADNELSVIPCDNGTVCAKKVMSAGVMCMDPRCSGTVGESGRFCADADTSVVCSGGIYLESACGAAASCVGGECVDDPVGPVDEEVVEPGPEAVEVAEVVEVVETPDVSDVVETGDIGSGDVADSASGKVGAVSRSIASREVTPGQSCGGGGVAMQTLWGLGLLAATQVSRSRRRGAGGVRPTRRPPPS